MTCCNKLIVFSDLDGTLIDHHTYQFLPALGAIKKLQEISGGLVLASSKTAPEVAYIRSEIGYDAWPAIIENGAGILPPFKTETPDKAEYAKIREALTLVPQELRALFRGFGDVTAADVVEMTGLSVDAAVLSQTRSFSEPGLWSGTDAQCDQFLSALLLHGITAQQGGRFLTLSFGANKVDQMAKIIDAHRPCKSVALGDAPNDVAMLEYADIGVIVANPSRTSLPPLKGENTGRIRRTKEPGPVGWNLAVQDIIKHFTLE